MRPMSSKCEKIAKNGKQCKNFKWSNGKYCYIHSFGKYSETRWISNGLSHCMGIMGVVFTLVTFLYTQQTGATRENQQQLKEGQKKMLHNGGRSTSVAIRFSEGADHSRASNILTRGYEQGVEVRSKDTEITNSIFIR